jgi:parvulin-like peptidyl-prolyl isomerase
MAGASYQIQVRHIQVAKKEIADLLVETIGAAKAGVPQVQMLMKLAGKYSNCPSKNDGGNLGWVEMGWNPEDPRKPRGGFKKLKNEELHDIICQALEKKEMVQGKIYGPVQTSEGYHAVIIASEFKTDRIL